MKLTNVEIAKRLYTLASMMHPQRSYDCGFSYNRAQVINTAMIYEGRSTQFDVNDINTVVLMKAANSIYVALMKEPYPDDRP
jgi:hypothetical protein